MSEENTSAQQHNHEFQVGGIDRQLSQEQQLEQLSSYIHAHYEQPEKNPPWVSPPAQPSDPALADSYDARLPDRLTHASMLMLGSALDHAMPGVAFADKVQLKAIPELNAQLFMPSTAESTNTQRWIITLHPGGWWKGSGVALENAWRPEVAAVAELSGIPCLDLDYPLLPEHNVDQVIAHVHTAVSWVRAQYPHIRLGVWGYSSGGALASLCAELFDAQALTFPHLDLDMLPKQLRGTHECTKTSTWPRTLFQLATYDEIAGSYPLVQQAENVVVKTYVSHHRISTPEVARQRVRDVAEFFNQTLGSC
ncbi:alpha/beta hydrolase [Corynebacterium sp. sy017]|uniref:alpha/beta hydrolase n=1 Tax=Corynebacterium sp. sy017 TaxID=2499527 RepID=UPI001186203D|nr:alpha/beta hydrolase [Corynebacterium sp. SY003]MBP3088336.1 alpha/beta hydrolase [Corynebacterium sp. sy017]TSD91656.1 alpha/beta hydrolase [Corynebacterium sp. SY003]